MWRDPETGAFSQERQAGLRRVDRPRVGLYRSFVPSMDEGWTRWILERFGFAYTRVTNADLQGGGLSERFDVLVFPDASPDAMHTGHKPGSMPPEWTGGIGDSGAAALRAFAEAGGTLVFLNDAAEYPSRHLGAGVKNALASTNAREFYAPGSLLRVRAEPHWITLGLPEDLTVWFENSPAFEVPANAKALFTYPDERLLASGWLLGGKHLVRRAAALDVPVGAGHMVLFGFRPQYRAQSYLTLKAFFNALTMRSGTREAR